MKKILALAAFVAVGITSVSCEADALNDSKNQLENVHADDLGGTPPVVGDDNQGEGPGDDVIILIPPNKPKL